MRLAYHLVGNRQDAEDLCQDCFLKLYGALPAYRPGLPFRPWFYRIATNVCIEFLRRNRGRPRWVSLFAGKAGAEEGVPLPEPPSDAPTPEEHLLTQEQRREVMDALMGLPAEARLLLALRYLNDLTYKELASALGIPEQAVGVKLLRAKQMLRRRLERDAGGQS
jgi:RNA polymerase sigma-70 factor (ECF subfamily)